jgi:hypothetical protein
MKEMKGAANEMATAAVDTIEKAKDIGRDKIDKSYEIAREYVSEGWDYADEIAESLTEFAQQQPWLALALAFALGLRQCSSIRKASLVVCLSRQTDRQIRYLTATNWH